MDNLQNRKKGKIQMNTLFAANNSLRSTMGH